MRPPRCSQSKPRRVFPYRSIFLLQMRIVRPIMQVNSFENPPMQDFDFNTARSLSVMRGGATRLGERVSTMGFKSVLVVTDRDLLAAGMLDSTLRGLSACGVAHHVFSDVVADPPESVVFVAAAAASARRGRPA